MQLNPLSQESASDRVVQAVADYSDTDPLELPRLFDAVEPEAFDAIVERLDDGYVRFQYAGYDVTAHGGGAIDVTPTSYTVDQQAMTGENGREFAQD